MAAILQTTFWFFHCKLLFFFFIFKYVLGDSIDSIHSDIGLAAKQPTCHNMDELSPNLSYKTHRIPKLRYDSSRSTVVFAQSTEARCQVENEMQLEQRRILNVLR